MNSLVVVEPANIGSLLAKSGFSGYDICLNPYVGCEFGCSYCYVRFFVKDPQQPWGRFVRTRDHIKEKLPKELLKRGIKLKTGSITDTEGKKQSLYKILPLSEARLVIGTMTDPYQPAEKRSRLTRTALEILSNQDMPQLAKVGIFTRSPLVLQDIELILKLPRPRVHFTITPLPQKVLRHLEPISPVTAARFKVIERLCKAGVRVHVNVAPILPGLSEGYCEEFTERLLEIGVAEYFVDPMQAYAESYVALQEALQAAGLSQHHCTLMQDKRAYAQWKREQQEAWTAPVVAKGRVTTLPIWSDHEHHVWIDMRSGEAMSRQKYGDDLGDQNVTEE